MPLALAAILSLGTFFGYVGIQSGAADQVVSYEKASIVRGHQPWGHEAIDYLKSPIVRKHLPWGAK